MTQSIPRAAIVGASSLLGKEIAEELNRPGGTGWDLTLLDLEETSGQVTAAGDEALVIQPLTRESFAGADIVFFAGRPADTRSHWRNAVAAGAGVVDLTGVLAEQPGITTRAPLLAGLGLESSRLDLTTEAVVAAHSTTLMLAYVAARLRAVWGKDVRQAATVLLPVSEQGKEGMDELHAQTVALLSFQSVPRDLYDAQVTFNLNAGFGGEARVDLRSVSTRIASELQMLLGLDTARRCASQCLQAPVFHGCSASIYLGFESAVELAQLTKALADAKLLTLTGEEADLPSNVTASEHETMQASLRAADTDGRGWWLWLVSDNLRLHARNAVACAAELRSVRPAAGRVQ